MLRGELDGKRGASGLLFISLIIYSVCRDDDGRGYGGYKGRYKVGGKWLKDVRFADDQAIVASSVLGLQTITDGLIRVAKQYDMKINVKKTKVMRISRTGEREMSHCLWKGR